MTTKRRKRLEEILADGIVSKGKQIYVSGTALDQLESYIDQSVEEEREKIHEQFKDWFNDDGNYPDLVEDAIEEIFKPKLTKQK